MSKVELMMEPHTPPMSWKDFVKKKPPFSIAIDGYVAHGPAFNLDGPHQNINHHEGVSRLETRATCAQALMLLRMGLFQTFKDQSDSPQMIIHANDCDEDICLTCFILMSSHLCTSVMNPSLNRLVFMEDMLDTTAGGYPFPKDLESYKELNWIYEPYRRFRIGGGLDRRNAEDYVGVVTDVKNRIMNHLTGNGKSIALDTEYEVIGGGTGWSMVKEIGINARVGMFEGGIDAFVAVRERPDGKYVYTIGRRSPYIPFDVLNILDHLNGLDGASEDRWGGGDLIGGSPRVNGSSLNPEGITTFINDFLG